MKKLFDEENRAEYLKTHRDEVMEHKTFCEIFLDTVKVVLKRDGINSATAATMEEFVGTDKK